MICHLNAIEACHVVHVTTALIWAKKLDLGHVLFQELLVESANLEVASVYTKAEGEGPRLNHILAVHLLKYALLVMNAMA